MRIKSLNFKFFFYVVYGLHIIENIRRLWRKLRNIDLGHHETWLSMRDYKVIHRFEVKIVGSKAYESKTKDFDSFLIDTRMTILWVNCMESHIVGLIGH